MDTNPWREPVTCKIGTGTIRTVASTDEAARYLLHAWPNPEGRMRKRAREVCLAVLAGKREPDMARAAFIAAAEEADMDVVP